MYEGGKGTLSEAYNGTFAKIGPNKQPAYSY